MTVKTWLHGPEDHVQNLEQFQIIHATKDLIETVKQMRSSIRAKTRPNWRQKLARALMQIAQHLEPDFQTPFRSRQAKQ